MSKLTLFYRLMVRPLLREPARTLVTLFAVALGVSVVVAIEMSGQAAAGSFQSSMEALSGNADLEVTATGGVPEEYLATLARAPQPWSVFARIEDHATVEPGGATVPLIGIDLVAVADSLPQEEKEDTTGFADLNLDHAAWVSGAMGRKGDTIRLLINDRQADYKIEDVVPSTFRGESRGDVVLMDIGAAQVATGKKGRLDRILIKVPPSDDISVWQKRVVALLPPGLSVAPRGAQSASNRRMLQAFRWNLRILSYVALVVGAFLIYNTISLSVVRRRHDIGIVRALGVSSRDVLLGFLCEALFFGIVGSLLAMPLGRLLAAGAVRLLSTTVDALYVSSRPGALSYSPYLVALTFVVGAGVAIASALSPAREASRVSPVEALAQGRREHDVRVERTRDAWIALGLALCSALCARVPAIEGKPIFGYLAALLLIAASAMAMPYVIYACLRFASEGLRRLLGVEALIASRSLSGSLRRTAVLVGALSTAVAMMTSVAIMVGSFRQTVVTWMDSQLPADLYLRPAGDPAADRHPTIALELTDRIAALPGVAQVDRFRAYEIECQGLPVTLASAETKVSRYYRASGFLSGRPANDVLAEMRNGDSALVSEPFANKHHVRAGDTIVVPLGKYKVPLRIVDVYYDYSTEKGVIIMDRATMMKYLPDPASSNLAVYLAPGADLEQVRSEIARAAANSDVLIFSNREIRGEAIRIFDQTFAITYALEVIAIIVAIVGVAGALVSIVIDRRREFGILRFIGASKAQVRSLILVEAGLLGLLSNAFGLILGILLSLILVFVINKQSFGWTIQFHWPVTVLISALSVVYVSTVLAGLYPAAIARRLQPIEVVHEE